ncbi:uncharacterized protein QC763_0040950 [Podospora pseudopauciseta]|uniref:Uncharacterized protein n=1 Tax=Podospora pseudopauciseta TaxID=2093780 RepID=A0ABR0HQA0_9PEZI|nr:hypothetical protein QC763_0040950 [Podospora pseudopauciseta]
MKLTDVEHSVDRSRLTPPGPGSGGMVEIDPGSVVIGWTVPSRRAKPKALTPGDPKAQLNHVTELPTAARLRKSYRDSKSPSYPADEKEERGPPPHDITTTPPTPFPKTSTHFLLSVISV